MKFIFADSQDYVDPRFDFQTEEFGAERRAQRDDRYAHEFFESAPYDGMLVSRATVGDAGVKGKYTTAQSVRFRRDGARAYLRYSNGQLFGDCGAFSYAKQDKPPYLVPEMVDYYSACGFTHAVSIDHVILGYNEAIDTFAPNGGRADPVRHDAVPEDWQSRYELTLKLAREFRERCEVNRAPFQPIGVAQGWSPLSYSEAVRRLVDMGYDYVALGGMVPLMAPQIRRVLDAVREVAPDVKLHLFGFTKADDLPSFVPYNIASFDSTSPLLRAFKDQTKNYLATGYDDEGNTTNKWYTAIRLPHADENPRFKQQVLAGIKKQKHLRSLERIAMSAIRSFAEDQMGIEEALPSIIEYGAEFHDKVPVAAYRATLTARPWNSCPCRACRESGVEVIIFRGSNRNRRRGFHNLWAFHEQLKKLRAESRPPEATAMKVVTDSSVETKESAETHTKFKQPRIKNAALAL